MKLNTIVLFALAAILSLALVAGCNSTTAPESNGTVGTDTTKEPAPSEAGNDLGETVAFTNDKGELVCPVQGDVIASPEKAAGFQDYEGTRYYFCCAGCPEAFAADPEKYAKK
jgi:YHS domain-containing protein